MVLRIFVPEDQACPVIPRAAVDDYLGRPAVQVVQQERAWPERAGIFAGQRRIDTQVNPGMVGVNSPPDVHDDQITALRPVYAHEAGRLVVLLVQACVFRALPPTVVR